MNERYPEMLESCDDLRSDRRLVSFVVPVFNEPEAIDLFVSSMQSSLAAVDDSIDFEYVFVNDGSDDETPERIRGLSSCVANLTLINLSRNFGKEAALAAGLEYARGDAVVPIDVDLQDPPQIIPEMLRKWQHGAKMVNAQRVSRTSESFPKRVTASLFYRIFNMLADRPIPSDVGDFRLLDREVVDVVKSLGERSRFNKALFSWVGYPTEYVWYERPRRQSGESKWSYWKLWKLALDGIFAASTTPLRIWTYIGFMLALSAFLYSIFILTRTLLLGIDTPGYASTIIIILTLGGFNMLALGIIGEYVGRIYREVRQRPLYIVESVETPKDSGDDAP